MEIPKLGHHMSICIDVKDMKTSIEFYKKLGFKIYSGGLEKGWATLTDDIIYIALFPDGFILKDFGVPVLFNYRGGNNSKINKYLESLNIEFEKRNEKTGGVGDSIISDPNGFKFYFDTTPDEERIDIE